MNDSIPADYLASLSRELETIMRPEAVEQWLTSPNQHLDWWEPVSLARSESGRERLDKVVKLMVAGMPL